MLARVALGGPQKEGRANYQVALTVCEHCRRGQLLAKGEVFEVAPEIAVARVPGELAADRERVLRFALRTLASGAD
jgi:hypothetical protein